MATDWNEVAAIGSAISAALAAVSAYLSFRTVTADVSTADFGNCLEVVNRLSENERRVRDATTDEHKLFEMRALVNFMETLAHLFNENKITPSTREFVKPYLIEAWAFLRSEEVGSIILGSVSSPTTYNALKEFAQRHKKEVENQVTINLARNAPTKAGD